MGKGIFELYKGDCRELLSQIDVSKIKLLLTDPPYGINYNAVKNNLRTFNDYGDIKGDDGMDLEFLFKLPFEQIVFGANNFPQFLAYGGRWICWDKRTNESADKALGSPFELAWTSRTQGYDKIYRVMHGGFVNDNGGKRHHPTEKPIQLMKKILNDYTKEGDWVIDCFMGSGTTGIAAVGMGRNFIGIEIEEKYFKIAEKRIKAEAAQSDLFLGEEKIWIYLKGG